MKNEEAEKLVCPFIVGAEGAKEINGFEVQNIDCITVRCMAWKSTEYHKIDDMKVYGGHCARLGNYEES